MKTLLLVLVVATASLAVASVQFAQQASAQRKRADTEMQLRQKQEALVLDLRRSKARLESEVATLREQDATPPLAVAATPRPRNASPPGVATVAAAETASSGMPPPPTEFRGRGPFQSAAGQNFMRARMKTSIRRLYGDAGQALGLSPEKSNQLLDLLADQQTRNIGDVRSKVPEGQTIRQYLQDQQKKNADEITALIGQERAADWAAYQKSLPERSTLGVVRDQLEQAGLPMTESQRTQMLAAITEESQRMPRPTPTQGLPPEETMAQMNQWQTEYDKALLDRAKQVLNTDQYSAYKDYQDWQTEMRANMPRGANGAPAAGMVFRSVGGNGNAVAIGPTVNVLAVPAQPMPAETPRK